MATAATSKSGAPKQEGESATATNGGRPTKALPQQPFDDNVSVQNIKAYLSNFGGKAKYSDMVTFFKRSLTDPASKARKRADFKDILSKIASFKTEDGERLILLRSPSSKCNNLQGHPPRPLSSPEQRRIHLLDRRLGSDSSASSQSSLSTCDSGIGLDSHSIAGNVAARARELGKSTDSLDDDLMNDLYDDEGVDYTVASGQSEFSKEEKKWMMYATLCDCQQLAAMMDKNPDLPSKRDFVTVCNPQL
ncbi:uncharacterized protein LOC135690795 [Rhopilema esculentum]|uniref:uncharacterized protein LOC135690795 n=1 Tax=Rhopilema esculentum TaxID=499914 RepID=UPI0031E2F4F2